LAHRRQNDLFARHWLRPKWLQLALRAARLAPTNNSSSSSNNNNNNNKAAAAADG